jgi:hypothetical protein
MGCHGTEAVLRLCEALNHDEERGTVDHCGRGARTKKAHPLYIHDKENPPVLKAKSITKKIINI